MVTWQSIIFYTLLYTCIIIKTKSLLHRKKEIIKNGFGVTCIIT